MIWSLTGDPCVCLSPVRAAMVHVVACEPLIQCTAHLLCVIHITQHTVGIQTFPGSSVLPLLEPSKNSFLRQFLAATRMVKDCGFFFQQG